MNMARNIGNVIMLFMVSAVTAKVIRNVVNFNYRDRGPDTWWFLSPEQCDDLLFPIQSPIALTTKDSISVKVPKLKLENYNNPVEETVVWNDGAGLLIHPVYSDDMEVPSVSEGTLIPEKKYQLDHIIFHWGPNNSVGAEHLIDKKRSPLEMQLVHFDNNLYSSYHEALAWENGVVILAVQFQMADTDNNNFQFLYKYFSKVKNAGQIDKISFEDLPEIQSLFAELDTNEYFSYHGSLTRPPCSNTVTWIIFGNQVPISAKQVECFRQLEDVHGRKLSISYRESKPTFNRSPIFRSTGHQDTILTRINLIDNLTKKSEEVIIL